MPARFLISFTLVIGDKEVESDKLNIMDRASKDIHGISKDEFILEIKKCR